MKKIICGFELEVPPENNPFGIDYEYKRVIKETEKAYLIEININHRSFGCRTVYKWICKNACKLDENGNVFVPVWLT